MALTDGTLNLIGTYLSTLAGYASIATADPGTTGINQSAAARVAVAYSVDADGDLTITGNIPFTGGLGGGPAQYVCLWSAATGGTFRGSYALTGDQTFNAAGEYTVTGITINGTASG